jgi:hypothetical protein
MRVKSWAFEYGTMRRRVEVWIEVCTRPHNNASASAGYSLVSSQWNASTTDISERAEEESNLQSITMLSYTSPLYGSAVQVLLSIQKLGSHRLP